MKFRLASILLVVAGLGWFGLVAAGFSIVWNYGNTPGQAATPPQTWPVESQIPRAVDLPTLVLLAHQGCPCTRASLGELDRVLARNQGLVKAYVLFAKPDGIPSDRITLDLWQIASAIPGVTVLPDEAGREAELFHAATSGQVVLYDATGQLLFDGGITGSRNHAGDNPGSSAITTLLTSGTVERNQTPVFGCELLNTPQANQTEGAQICSP